MHHTNHAKQRVSEETEGQILPVSKFFYEKGEFIGLCPHCQLSIVLDSDELDDCDGEQYEHRCGETIEVQNPVVVRTPQEAGLD